MYGKVVGPSAPDIYTVLREDHADGRALGCSVLHITGVVGLGGGKLGAWMKASFLAYVSTLGLSCSWLCGSTHGERLGMSGLEHRFEYVV